MEVAMDRPKVVMMFAVGVLATVLPLRAEAPAGAKDLARENVELKAQVEALRAEVKALKAQLRAAPELRMVPYGVVPAPPGQSLPIPTPVPAERMPEGTVRREFNGAPVYVIPLARGEAAARN
jgi:outer membrane murein-binding lipoprotein Lpp